MPNLKQTAEWAVSQFHRTGGTYGVPADAGVPYPGVRSPYR
jgi:hypothetical protein